MKSIEAAKKEYQKVINPPGPKKPKKLSPLSLARNFLSKHIDEAIKRGDFRAQCTYYDDRRDGFSMHDMIVALAQKGYDVKIRNAKLERFYDNYNRWNIFCKDTEYYNVEISGWDEEP